MRSASTPAAVRAASSRRVTAGAASAIATSRMTVTAATRTRSRSMHRPEQHRGDARHADADHPADLASPEIRFEAGGHHGEHEGERGRGDARREVAAERARQRDREGDDEGRDHRGPDGVGEGGATAISTPPATARTRDARKRRGSAPPKSAKTSAEKIRTRREGRPGCRR